MKGNLNGWNVQKVTTMHSIFARSISFNADISGISNWDTLSLKDIREGFKYALNFVGDLSRWNTSQVTSLDHLFFDSGGKFLSYYFFGIQKCSIRYKECILIKTIWLSRSVYRFPR